MCRLNVLIVCLLHACLLQLVACDNDGDGSRIIDLTYTFDENTLFYPGHEAFVHEIIHRGPYGPLWYESNRFKTGEHTGTHMDAPAHLTTEEGGMRMDVVPVSRLVGPGVKIDISSKAAIDPDALVEVEDLEAWEKENGAIPDGAILMMFSDWGKFYPNRTAYYRSDRNDTHLNENGTSLLHFPGVSPDAADWLIENRNIVGIGVDTASIDHGPSTNFTTHVKIFKQNIFGLENVANLENMPTTGSTIYALPMKIKDGSGAPVRIIAIVSDGTNGARATCTNLLALSAFLFLYRVIV